MDPERFEELGYATTSPIIDAPALARYRTACDCLSEDRRSRAGVRDLLRRDPAFSTLAASPQVRALVDPILGPAAFVTHSILFDKTPDTNWDVVWHQDITIAVHERLDTPGFGPWSIKAGVPHVQPPAPVLEGMLTVRVHLDDCFAENGPLLVVPGSHRRGVLDADFDPARCDAAATACTVPAGGAVIMRPLILHASRKAIAPAHRRVVHLEFARDPLPGGLAWARM